MFKAFDAKTEIPDEPKEFTGSSKLDPPVVALVFEISGGRLGILLPEAI